MKAAVNFDDIYRAPTKKSAVSVAWLLFYPLATKPGGPQCVQLLSYLRMIDLLAAFRARGTRTVGCENIVRR